MTIVIPVPAATVMLVRDGIQSGPGEMAGGVEVFMMERSRGGDFGGLYVFPGGKVDVGDGVSPALDPDLLSERSACEILDVAEGGLAHWVACLRECFEEAGLLLARARDGEMLELRDPARRVRVADYRDRLNRGDDGALAEVCEREELLLAIDHLAYVAHWITPEDQPRRYDTRFFVALAPPHQEAIHDGHEAVESFWIRPEEALARNSAGEMAMISPTLHNLKGLCGFASAEEVLAAKRQIDPKQIPTIVPRVRRRGGKVEEVLQVVEK